jgi:catechol 2,3-dioxygenase-like lactoylglutathione lyase family enzyme
MPDSNRPKLGALNHASIPVRDLKEAKRFYTEVLGGAYWKAIPDSPRSVYEERSSGCRSRRAGGRDPTLSFRTTLLPWLERTSIHSSSTSRRAV